MRSEESTDGNGHGSLKLPLTELAAGYALGTAMVYLAYQEFSQLGWLWIPPLFLAIALIWDGTGRLTADPTAWDSGE